MKITAKDKLEIIIKVHINELDNQIEYARKQRNLIEEEFILQKLQPYYYILDLLKDDNNLENEYNKLKNEVQQ